MIPTCDEFRTNVGKGPNLNKVTLALENYWTDKGNRTLDQQAAALKLLIDACKAWIKLKVRRSRKLELGVTPQEAPVRGSR